MNVFRIGVAGGTGAGKTTLAERVIRDFGGRVAVLSEDSYYRANAGLSPEERERLNYDHPDALETELLIRHLETLGEGGAVQVPVYDFRTHSRLAATRKVEPRPVVLVEGILLFHHPELRRLFDLKIFVDADADERVLRRILRDTRERGRELEGVVRQYLQTVKPMHSRFVEPTRAFADIVLNGGRSEAAYDLLRGKIEALLA